MNRDVIAGLGLLGFAGLYFAATLRIQESSLSDEVGANGIPLVLAALLAVLAVALAARGWFAGRAARPVQATEVSEDGASFGRVLGFLGIAAVYGLVAYVLGYVAGLVVLIVGIAVYEGARPSWSLLAVAVGGAAFFYVVFVRLLGVAQPPGLF